MTTRTMSRRTFGQLSAGTFAAAAFGTPSILRAQTAITFAVPNPSALTWLPYWVAVGEGYFTDEGLDPRLEAIDGSSAVLQAMTCRPGTDRRAGPGPTLRRGRANVDVKFIYNLYPNPVFRHSCKRRNGPFQTPLPTLREP